MNASAQAELNGVRKAAILLVLLGDSAASKICDHLPQDSLRALAEEISSLGDIPEETANMVLREYESMSGQKKSLAQGGPEYAEKVLIKDQREQRNEVRGSRNYRINKNFRASPRNFANAPNPNASQPLSKTSCLKPSRSSLLHLDGQAAGNSAVSALRGIARASGAPPCADEAFFS